MITKIIREHPAWSVCTLAIVAASLIWWWSMWDRREDLPCWRVRPQPVTSVAWSPDCRRIALWYAMHDRDVCLGSFVICSRKALDQAVMLVSLPSGAANEVFLNSAGRINGVVFSRDGSMVAGGFRGTMLISPDQLAVTALTTSETESIVSSVDGSLIAVARDDHLDLMSCSGSARPEIRWSIDVKHVTSKPAFSHTNREVAIRSGETLLVYEAASGTLLRSIKALTSMYERAPLPFSWDGSMLACQGDKTVEIYNAQTGGHIKSLPASPLTQIDFVESGELVTGSPAGGLTVWDTASWQDTTPKPLRRLAGIMTVQVAPDGKTLAIGDERGWLRIWDTKASPASQPPL